jgi:hypothetical protein
MMTTGRPAADIVFSEEFLIASEVKVAACGSNSGKEICRPSNVLLGIYRGGSYVRM